MWGVMLFLISLRIYTYCILLFFMHLTMFIIIITFFSLKIERQTIHVFNWWINTCGLFIFPIAVKLKKKKCLNNSQKNSVICKKLKYKVLKSIDEFKLEL